MKTLPKLSWVRHDAEHEYQVTEQDWDTLVRAVAHEGKPYDGVVWCLLQRYAWIVNPDGSHPYSTFDAFVQAYAQPINPRWFPDGTLHLAYLRRNALKKTRVADEKARALRRVEYAAQPIEDIADEYKDIVNPILAGTEDSTVSGAVHYSASFARRGSNQRTAQIAAGQFAKKRRMGPVVDSGVGYKRGVNWFFAAGGSHRVDMQLTMHTDSADELVAEHSTGCNDEDA